MTVAPPVNYDEIVDSGDADDPARGGGYRREPWFIFPKEEGAISFFRPLTESAAWRNGLTHNFIPVLKPQPEDEKGKGKWPKMMSATCRKDPKLAVMYPDGCPICNFTGVKDKYGNTWAEAVKPLRYTLAVEREQVMGDGTPELGGPAKVGKPVLRDKTVNLPLFGEDGQPVEGETIEVPSIVIVRNTMFSLFQALRGIGEAYQSLTGQDIRVTRTKSPNGNGTVLTPIPMPPDPAIMPGTQHWQLYTDTVGAWVPGGLSVAQIIGQNAEETFYDRFFTTQGVIVPPKGGIPSGDDGAATAQAAVVANQAPAAAVPDAEKLAALRARIQPAS